MLYLRNEITLVENKPTTISCSEGIYIDGIRLQSETPITITPNRPVRVSPGVPLCFGRWNGLSAEIKMMILGFLIPTGKSWYWRGFFDELSGLPYTSIDEEVRPLVTQFYYENNELVLSRYGDDDYKPYLREFPSRHIKISCSSLRSLRVFSRAVEDSKTLIFVTVLVKTGKFYIPNSDRCRSPINFSCGGKIEFDSIGSGSETCSEWSDDGERDKTTDVRNFLLQNVQFKENGREEARRFIP